MCVCVCLCVCVHVRVHVVCGCGCWRLCLYLCLYGSGGAPTPTGFYRWCMVWEHVLLLGTMHTSSMCVCVVHVSSEMHISEQC